MFYFELLGRIIRYTNQITRETFSLSDWNDLVEILFATLNLYLGCVFAGISSFWGDRYCCIFRHSLMVIFCHGCEGIICYILLFQVKTKSINVWIVHWWMCCPCSSDIHWQLPRKRWSIDQCLLPKLEVRKVMMQAVVARFIFFTLAYISYPNLFGGWNPHRRIFLLGRSIMLQVNSNPERSLGMLTTRIM